MAHGYTAARLVERIYGVTPTDEALILQQLMLGAEFLQNHIRHFYLLALPDYLPENALPGSGGSSDCHFSSRQSQMLIEHYFAAMDYSRKCHDMLAVFGGKIPHQHGLVGEGVAVLPTSDRKMQFLALLHEVQSFLREDMLPDVQLLADVYPDYFRIGTRPPTFISYGLFDPRFGGHFPSGVFDGERILPVVTDAIKESIAFSWFEHTGEDQVVPAPNKPNAYSWAKAPRYAGLALEGGPLARKIIRSGPQSYEPAGTMQRLLARAEESSLIAGWTGDWLSVLPERGQYITPLEKVAITKAVQTNDAPRGALLHAMEVTGDEIAFYDIITPTTWNFSPKDDQGKPGPAEEALIGTALCDSTNPIEVGRIIRAFDPCITCGTHVMDTRGKMVVDVEVGC
jgi:hydrogenase large subunit